MSVLVPVLDEAEHIARSAEAIRAQRLDVDIEFLFMDGGSSDGTREFLEGLARRDTRVRVLHNAARIIPAALNLGLCSARGRYIVRMDAHTQYPPNYVGDGLRRLSRGDAVWVSGPQVPVGDGRWSRLVQLALSSWLGVGGATFRRADREIEVDTGYTGILAKSTLTRVGGWDEEWLVNEDAEIASRIREGGGRILCVPEMAASYRPRDSLQALARQYWRYGYYRAKTSRRHRGSMRRSHLFAPGLVLTLASAAVTPPPARTGARAGLALYAATVAVVSARLTKPRRPRDVSALIAVFTTMHVAWGGGFLRGCLRFGPPRVRRPTRTHAVRRS